jgi:alpha-ketoglutarate-dependent 2,4-dichlorophenoxyacetate dioxygenase
MLSIAPQGPSFLAEVTGVDFSRPMDAATLREIVHAMDTFAVCVFRDTGMTDEAHIAFSYLLGKLECRSRVEASHRAGELGLL